jgi:CRP-like cAMP-binding protein
MAETLRSIQLFQCFNDAELAQLEKSGERKTVSAFAHIVIEGELSWGLYVILEGTVGVFKKTESGKTYDVGHLKQGGFFGEMSLVDELPRSATVRALTETKLFYLSKESFNQFLAASPDRKMRFFENCTAQLIKRLRELNDNYVITQYQLWKSALKGERKEAV